MFFGRDVAFMQLNRAGFANLYIHTSAVFLRRFHMIPCMEAFADIQHDDIRPSLGEKRVPLGGDGGVLQGPELIEIAEITGLIEQVRHDAAFVCFQRKQRGLSRDFAAEKPLFQSPAARRALFRVLIQLQAFGLLRLACQSQMTDGLSVDFLIAVGLTDAGQKIAERERATHHKFDHTEGSGDVLHRSAFLDEPGERLPARYLVGIKPCGVFDQRRLKRRRVVAILHNRTRHRRRFAPFLGDLFQGEEPSPPGDDFIALTVLAHEKRLLNAPRADGRQNVGNVRRFARMAHVQRRDFQLIEGNVLQVHEVTPLVWDWAPRRLRRGEEDREGRFDCALVRWAELRALRAGRRA